MKCSASATAGTLLILFSAHLFSTRPAHAQMESADKAAVRGVVEQFHVGLSQGDSSRVANLLAEDLVVLEGGLAETKEEYLSHHFHSDAAFLAGLQKENESMHVTVEGDAAWASSTSRMFGTFRDRDIDSNSAELLVLRRSGDSWKIEAIHWSSGTRR